MTTTLTASALPLPLLRRGKVREVYEVDELRLLLVASDRISAFDVVLKEPVPAKGGVLTQLSAFWFGRFEGLVPHHCLTSDAGTIVTAVPALLPYRDQLAVAATATTVFQDTDWQSGLPVTVGTKVTIRELRLSDREVYSALRRLARTS